MRLALFSCARPLHVRRSTGARCCGEPNVQPFAHSFLTTQYSGGRVMAERWIRPILVVAFLASPLPVWAGQEPDVPAIEIGVEGAVARDFYDGGGRPWGPRVTFNLSPETALVMFGENRVEKGNAHAYSWSSRLSGAEIRQAVAQSGPFTFHVIAGGGVSFRSDSRAHVGTGPLPAAFVGAGFGQRVGRHFSVRQEFRFVLAGDGSELRAQLGFSTPIGRYPQSRVIESRMFGAAIVRTGQYVWLTRADGIDVAGSVTRITPDEIILATTAGLVLVPVADVQRLERPDGVGDGIRRGAVIGAGAGAALLAVLNAACRGDCMYTWGALILGGGVGGALGAAGGAVVDGVSRHRETIFERAAPGQTVTVFPLVRPRSTGVAARIAW